MDLQRLIRQPEYDFLRTDEHLGDRIVLLGLGGSRAYGTENEHSDTDLRGITLMRPSDLLGLTSFEQIVETNTDTVIYGFNKMAKLLLECNPNTLEILGLDDDQYVIRTPIGDEIIKNRHLFLSKRAIKSFAGYADDQLRRLQNAIARDRVSQSEKEKHILKSVNSAMEDFNRRYEAEGQTGLRLYIDQSQKEDFETEIFVDASYEHFPLRDFTDLWGTMRAVVVDYDKIGKRNKKKDIEHLNKHAMHLIRLFMMAIDILEKQEIITRRTQERALLRSIRSGDYMLPDGTFSDDFYALLEEYERRLEEAKEKTTLPDNPDMEKVGAFVEKINRMSLEMG